MKKHWLWVCGLVLLAAGCTFRVDFLGEDRMQEVVLVKSPAKEKVLVVDVEGMISTLAPGSVFNREGDMLSQVYARLQRAGEDKLVRGIILRLDTPGGDVTSSDILYREVLKFKKRTGLPVVALMMGVAASGGYYVASACDAIIAHPSTITGSIGVISLFPDVEGLLSKVGVKVQVIKSGELKDAGSPFRNLNEQEQRLFQGIIDELYARFLDVVHEKRKDALSLEESKKGFTIDIAEVAESVRGRCALLGNLDAIRLLPEGSEQELRAEIARQAAAGRRNGGRFVMSLGSPVTPGTSPERVRRYCAMVQSPRPTPRPGRSS